MTNQTSSDNSYDDTTEAHCDKCGRLVSLDNSLSEVLAEIDPLALLLCGIRHLLPVTEDGVMVCEGSPSNAQYIEGQPRDTRGYPYSESRETLIRGAYARLQARCAEQHKAPDQ